MAHDGVSRRGFIKSVGTVAAATALTRRVPAPRAAHASAQAPPRLHFGVQTPPQHATYDDIRQVWLDCDELGYDSAFVFDHLMPIFSDPNGPCFEGWTLLAALAAQTTRLKVGVLVTGNTYRHPAVLAKMAVTVDHVSRGRLILGMGAGWFELEHQAYGIPFHTPGERARRVVESVTLIKQLFAQEKSTFAGKYYQLADAPFEPKPVQRPHPPILIGGMGPKVMQPLAARHADIWHFFVKDNDPRAAAKINADFDAVCRRVGRDPAAVERAVFLRSSDLVGVAAKDIRGRIAALDEAGVDHIILSLQPPYDRVLLRTFAREVIPAFQNAPARSTQS